MFRTVEHNAHVGRGNSTASKTDVDSVFTEQVEDKTQAYFGLQYNSCGI